MPQELTLQDTIDQVYKVVVFDMDETLGYFLELGIFWDALGEYNRHSHAKQLSQLDFNALLDLYPEFLRPNILHILQYLKGKKDAGMCQQVMIYTNNMGPKSWTHMVKNYFDVKLDYPLFDRAICAYKVNNVQVEQCRTTHEKTVPDLIRCGKIPANSEICFLDDLYHPRMIDDNVHYINLKPYSFTLSYEEMLERYMHSRYFKEHMLHQNMSHFHSFMLSSMRKYHFVMLRKSQQEYEVDKIISKKIMQSLEVFFTKKWREEDQRNVPTTSPYSRVRSISSNTLLKTPRQHTKKNIMNGFFM